jgi:HJR/Mrr/RecB family endonuclease
MATDIIHPIIVDQPNRTLPSDIQAPTSNEVLLYTFKTLIKKYKKQMGDNSDVCIVSGGLQQYLNKQRKSGSEEVQAKNGVTFNDLPVSYYTIMNHTGK